MTSYPLRFAAVLLAGLLAASCGGSDDKAPKKRATPTTLAPTTTTDPTAAVRAAIDEFEQSQGLTPGTYEIAVVEISTTDSSYAYFTVRPPASNPNAFQPEYGFALQSGGSWTVIGAGSSDVGCDGSPGVPDAVLEEFGVGCG